MHQKRFIYFVVYFDMRICKSVILFPKYLRMTIRHLQHLIYCLIMDRIYMHTTILHKYVTIYVHKLSYESIDLRKLSFQISIFNIENPAI